MASPTADPDSPSSSTSTSRFGATGLVLLALLVVVGVIAYLLLRDDGGGAGASAETLVVLDQGEMHHIGDDGEITASFDLDVDTEALSRVIVLGSHITAMTDDEVIVIDAVDGEVHRFELPEAEAGGLGPAPIVGQTSLVMIGSPAGTSVLDIIDLSDGTRHHLAGAGDDSIYTTDMVRSSPDGSRVGVSDFRAESETPTVILSLDDGERIQLPGFLAGLSDNRAITSEPQPDSQSLILRWFDESGEETWRTSFEPPDMATAMPDGSLVYIVDGTLHRLSEGNETPEVLDGPDLTSESRITILPVGSSGGMILATSEEALLLDRDAQTLASGPRPDPWVFDRTRTGRRCLALGLMSQPGLVFDLDSGETLTDGTVHVFAQSPGDGCTLVTGQIDDDEAEYTVLGTDVVHVTEPDIRVSGVSSGGQMVAMSQDGVFFLPTDDEGARIQIFDKPVWHQFITLDR